LSDGRRVGLCLPPLSAGYARGRVSAYSEPESSCEELGMADHATQCGGLCPGSHPPPRPSNRRTPRLAPRLDEHGGTVEGDAECGLPGLTIAGVMTRFDLRSPRHCLTVARTALLHCWPLRAVQSGQTITSRTVSWPFPTGSSCQMPARDV